MIETNKLRFEFVFFLKKIIISIKIKKYIANIKKKINSKLISENSK